MGAAFVAGLVTSLHCVGMCGPLVCALVPGGAGAHGGLSTGGALYHAGRMVSYGSIGALVGLLGAGPLSFVSGKPLVCFQVVQKNRQCAERSASLFTR